MDNMIKHLIILYGFQDMKELKDKHCDDMNYRMVKLNKKPIRGE